MKIAVIGCGTMGGAFARHFAKEHKVILIDPHKEKTEKLAKEIKAIYETDIQNAVKEADYILLAVKPQDLSEVAQLMAPVLNKKQTIISILAGVTLETLNKSFGRSQVVRLTPNIALLVEKAVLGFVQNGVPTKIKGEIEKLFTGLGLITWIPEERMDALMAITASGPAFWLLLLEAFIEGSLILGFHPHESQEYLLQTMEGVIALLREKNQHPGALKWSITTPMGMTIAGLKKMEDHGIRSAIVNGLLASCAKAEEMGAVKRIKSNN